MEYIKPSLIKPRWNIVQGMKLHNKTINKGEITIKESYFNGNDFKGYVPKIFCKITTLKKGRVDLIILYMRQKNHWILVK